MRWKNWKMKRFDLFNISNWITKFIGDSCMMFVDECNLKQAKRSGLINRRTVKLKKSGVYTEFKGEIYKKLY